MSQLLAYLFSKDLKLTNFLLFLLLKPYVWWCLKVLERVRLPIQVHHELCGAVGGGTSIRPFSLLTHLFSFSLWRALLLSKPITYLPVMFSVFLFSSHFPTSL